MDEDGDKNDENVEVKEGEGKAKPKLPTSDEYIKKYELHKSIGEMLNSLFHEMNPEPYLFMIKYFAGKVSEEEWLKNNIQIPKPYPWGRPIVKFPKFSDNHSPYPLLKKYLTKPLFKAIKHRKTKYGGDLSNIMSIIQTIKTDKTGLIITDSDCIAVFNEIFIPVIQEVHSITISFDQTLNKISIPYTYFSNSYDSIVPGTDYMSNNYQRMNAKLKSFSFSISRNVQNYPFNQYLSKDTRRYINTYLLKEITLVLNSWSIPFKLYSWKDNSIECEDILRQIKYPFSFLTHANLKQNWPDNRTLLANEDHSIVILINFIDHFFINIKCVAPNINILSTVNTVLVILRKLNINTNWECTKELGNIVTNPTYLGGGAMIHCECGWKKLHKLKWLDLNALLKGNLFDTFNYTKSDDYSKWETGKSSKLYYNSIQSFLENCIKSMSGVWNLDEEVNQDEPGNLSKFNKKILNDNTWVKTIYEELFDQFKYTVGNYGHTINDWIVNDKLWIGEQGEYQSFHVWIKDFLKQAQKFDIGRYDHIHKIEGDGTEVDEEEVFKSDESKPNGTVDYKGRVAEIEIIIRRNIDGFRFSWLNYGDDLAQVVRKIKEMITIFNDQIKEEYALNHPKKEQHANEKTIHFCNNVNERKTKLKTKPIIKQELDKHPTGRDNDEGAAGAAVAINPSELIQMFNLQDNTINGIEHLLHLYNYYKDSKSSDIHNKYWITFPPSFSSIPDVVDNYPSPFISAIVNDVDHFKWVFSIKNIMANKYVQFNTITETYFKKCIFSLLNLLNVFSQYIKFIYDMKLGFITAEPMHLGTALTLRIKITKLNIQTIDKISSLCENVKNEFWKCEKINDSDVVITNKRTIGISEMQLFAKVIMTIREILNYKDKHFPEASAEKGEVTIKSLTNRKDKIK